MPDPSEPPTEDERGPTRPARKGSGEKAFRDLLRGSHDLFVLSVLADGPQYGYAIARTVNARTEGEVTLSPAVLYPLLHRLEADGLVSANWEEVVGERNDGKRPGRRRKWYRLSAKGRRRLEQRTRAHRAMSGLVESFLSRTAKGGG